MFHHALPLSKDLLKLLGVESWLEHNQMLDASFLSSDYTGGGLTPSNANLRLHCCKKGHVVGVAAVDLAMVGHLGWGIAE